MSTLIFIIICAAAVFALAMRQAPTWAWAASIAVLSLLAGPVGSFWSPIIWIGWLLAAGLAALSFTELRRNLVTRPAFKSLKGIMPKVSETEREALEAGTVGWDAQLFSGTPDWSQLSKVAPITLTEEEKAFLDGPTEELCRRINDWDIRFRDRNISPETWKFMADNGFFGMLISKEHGGLGFSPQAQSLVIGKVASRSPDAATIVMVPNSLGPAS